MKLEMFISSSRPDATGEKSAECRFACFICGMEHRFRSDLCIS